MIKKYKLTTNLSLKIVAFVFAAFLWLIVANVDNPVVRNTYANIPVTIVNEDVITQGGEVYSVLDEQNVNVVVYAKRSVIQQISSDEIVATADIKEMDAHTGLIPIKITIPSHSGEYQSAEASPRNIQIKTEKTGKAVFTLSVSATGVPRDGYMTGEMKVNPEKITITGAESKISQIKKAEAKINVDGLSKDTEVEAELVLYDAAENVISQSQLSNNLGSEGITVDVEVLQKKSVPVQFSVSGEPAEGYLLTVMFRSRCIRATRSKISSLPAGCTSEPASVQICGKSTALANVTEITVPGSEMNIQGATEKVEKTIDISKYLPEGVSLVDDAAKNVTATATIEEDGTRTVDFMVASIKIRNLSDSLQVSYEPDAEVILTFRGSPKLLEALDVSNAVSVNLQNFTKPGTYDVPVDVDLPTGVSLSEKAVVKLTLTEKEEQDSSESQDLFKEQ